MNKAKLMIAFILLLLLCVSVACFEYHLMMRFGIVLSVFAGVSGLYLLGALLRAPEGYEDEKGFHIRQCRKRAARPRHDLAVSHSRS